MKLTGNEVYVNPFFEPVRDEKRSHETDIGKEVVPCPAYVVLQDCLKGLLTVLGAKGFYVVSDPVEVFLT